MCALGGYLDSSSILEYACLEDYSSLCASVYVWPSAMDARRHDTEQLRRDVNVNTVTRRTGVSAR